MGSDIYLAFSNKPEEEGGGGAPLRGPVRAQRARQRGEKEKGTRAKSPSIPSGKSSPQYAGGHGGFSAPARPRQHVGLAGSSGASSTESELTARAAATEQGSA